MVACDAEDNPACFAHWHELEEYAFLTMTLKRIVWGFPQGRCPVILLPLKCPAQMQLNSNYNWLKSVMLHCLRES